ncbi:MAG: glycosyltransferase [Bacteroidales bacterium]|jgi:glycosyltransferase involved in cell wall biosynthesis|nr:glycosyltransferase [Bacteroidales bacterium]
MNQKKSRNKTITYFHRNPKAGFSIAKVSGTFIREIRKTMDVEEFCVPEYKAAPQHIVKNIWFVFKHRNKYGINHITGDIHYCILALIGCKSVLTIHDLCLLEHVKNPVKKKIMYWLWYKLPVLITNKVICISENTKKELAKITNRKDIEVIYNAVDTAFWFRQKVFNEQQPVILQIGTGWNKNIYNVIKAIAFIPCHFRIIGDINNEISKMLEKNAISYSTISNLSDEEIVQEYKKCDVVCFCSVYEGFGMPIIEGNAVGRCVITSFIPPMTEIAADAACFVNPHDSSSIEKGFRKIILDAGYRNQLIERGRKNSDKFQPCNAASSYIKLYRLL